MYIVNSLYYSDLAMLCINTACYKIADLFILETPVPPSPASPPLTYQ